MGVQGLELVELIGIESNLPQVGLISACALCLSDRYWRPPASHGTRTRGHSNGRRASMPTRMPTDRASPAPLSSGVLQAITRHSTQSHPIISYPACQQRKYAPLQKKKKLTASSSLAFQSLFKERVWHQTSLLEPCLACAKEPGLLRMPGPPV